jgi:hypothetical protein
MSASSKEECSCKLNTFSPSHAYQSVLRLPSKQGNSEAIYKAAFHRFKGILRRQMVKAGFDGI